VNASQGREFFTLENLENSINRRVIILGKDENIFINIFIFLLIDGMPQKKFENSN